LEALKTPVSKFVQNGFGEYFIVLKKGKILSLSSKLSMRYPKIALFQDNMAEKLCQGLATLREKSERWREGGG
jgi:hypothetical protein